MADIKIRIQADSASAIKELEKLSSSSDKTSKSLTKLSNRVVEALSPDSGVNAMDRFAAQKQYLNAIDRTIKSYELSGNAAEAYRKQVSLLSREYQKMAAIAPKNAITGLLGSRLGSAETNLDTTLQREAEMQKEAAKAADKHTSAIVKQESSMKNLISSFVSANAIYSLASRALSAFMNVMQDSAELAAEAEETLNLFNVTFESTGSVARNTAAEISSSLGIAQSSAQEALGMFGSLAQGYGETQSASLDFAEEAVRTTLDLISFRNITGDVNTIMSEFSSGLVGNYENFRKWGIVITANEVNARLMAKGLSGLTGEALQLAKIQETLNIVQERSGNAMGDMERTLDSTANVARRVTEANKELMENMGDSLNKVLTPLRRMWLDIADTINKANRAQEEFASGSKNISVYDIHGNEEDRNDFASTMVAHYGDYFNARERNAGAEELSLIENEIIASLTKFAATADDVVSVLPAKVFQGDIGSGFLEIVNTVSRTVENEREYQKALESRQKALENSMSAAQSFFDSISGIAGVSISQSAAGIVIPGMEGAKNDASVAMWQENLSEGISAAIDEALSSIDAAGWERFVSPIEKALGLAGESEGLKGKLEAYEDLYEAVYNQHLKDGELTDEELKQLDAIIAAYTETHEILKSITAEKERQQELDSAIGSMAKSRESYERKLQDLADKSAISASMPGAASNIVDNEISRSSALRDIDSMKAVAMAFASTDEELNAIAESFLVLYGAANEYYDAAKAELEKENSKDIAEAYAAALSAAAGLGAKAPGRTWSSNESAQELGNDLYEDLMSTISDMEKILRESGLNEDAIASYTNEIRTTGIDSIVGAVSAEEDRQNSMVNGYDNAGDAALGSLGEVGELATAFQNISASAGGLVGILINLAAETELVSRVCSFLSDTLLPVLNAFLAPMLPVLDILTDLFQNLFTAVLAPAFPILKMIASALTVVFGLLNIVVGFLSDSVKWVVGWIMKGVTGLINGIIDVLNWLPFVNIKKLDTTKWTEWANTDVFGNVEDRWNDMQDTLDEIAGLNMEIADNTSESPDLSVYNEMLQKGLLNSSEYAAMVSNALGRNYDNVLTYGDGAYWSGAGGSTNISNDNISIVINGDGLNSREIAEEVIRRLNEKQRGGSMLYA